MSVELSSVVRQSERTASRVVEGQAVVIVIDEQKLHTLNDVGTFLWGEVGEGCAVSALVDALLESYDVERERATADVLQFVEELLALGALETQEPT